ncbi:hypothetical protein ACFL4X_02565 [Gemmatimonadota bacterium]
MSFLIQVEYRRKDVRGHCLAVLDLVTRHYNHDGGFSYFTGRSGENYYGVKYADSPAGSDLHGTSLLSWAIAIILKIFDGDICDLRKLKP